MPTIISTPISDCTLSVVPVMNSATRTPVRPVGTASRIRNGSRNDRNCATRIRYSSTSARIRPSAKLVNDDRMPCTMPRMLTRTPAGSFVCLMTSVDASGQRAEVFAGGIHVDVDDAADLVVIDFGRRRDRRHLRDRVEQRRILLVLAVQRDAAQVEQVADAVFRILDREHVVVAAARIHPEARGDHLIRRERRDHVVHDLALVEAEIGGALAIDVEPQRRVVDVLRDVDVADAGQACGCSRPSRRRRRTPRRCPSR